jgi:NAD(P)-dependent dehydrogenase (short-subunit alcohol dehydrogenase family)
MYAVPDQAGKLVVVTGASSGIGLVAARELARAGARVVLAVRNTEKGQRVAAGIPGSIEVRPLDLASLASVRAFAAGWTGALDILVNNAGIMAVPEGRTADGFELQIGTNHLGPFLLTDLLLPAITDRVVTVSSQLHRRGRIDLDDLNWERRGYNATGAYNARCTPPPRTYRDGPTSGRTAWVTFADTPRSTSRPRAPRTRRWPASCGTSQPGLPAPGRRRRPIST